MTDLIQLPLKILVTYFIIYYLLPKYFNTKKYKQLVLISILLVISSGSIFRIIQGKITLPIFYHERQFTPWDPGRFLWALFEVFFPAMLATSIVLIKSKFESMKREQELQKEKLKTELNFLKAQINPHFLFNTLNNIYGLSLINSPQTSGSILKLSELLRFILRKGTLTEIKIEDEVKILYDYIELEKLRYGERLNYSFQTEIDNQDEMIAPLLLLPFVENSFKHGASESRFISFISIYLKLIDGLLVFKITNSKEKKRGDNENGLGLKNIQRQLELTYGIHHHLDIQNTVNDFSISLTINLKEYEKTQLYNR